MRTFFMLLALSACGQKSEPASSGSAAAPPVETKVVTPGSAAPVAPAGSATAAPTESDGSDEVAELVVHDVGSKALGNQKIEASCVSVLIMPAGKWTVASARLQDCGDKTARSILWLYKRQGQGKWNEDYVGQPPKCWKGVPADISDAVTKATKIPSC
jgi:hypothetical protein